METVKISGVSKYYHGRAVLKDVSMDLEGGGLYCLMGPSGIGKTTLLRLLMGLEQPDAGTITGVAGRRVSAVFQENRLLEYADAIQNIRIVSGRNGMSVKPEEVLCEFLEEEAWYRPVRELSGGMKRRVAVARALAADSDLLVMDEPFTGLDEQTKRMLIRAIRKFQRGRTLLVVTHQEEDGVLLEAQILRLEKESISESRSGSV